MTQFSEGWFIAATEEGEVAKVVFLRTSDFIEPYEFQDALTSAPPPCYSWCRQQ